MLLSFKFKITEDATLTHCISVFSSVALFLAVKQESVAAEESDGESREVVKPFMWVEFVDRDVQPNYIAQRGIDVHKIPHTGTSARREAIKATKAICGVTHSTLFHFL